MFSDTVAFSDAQTSRTPPRAQEKQAFSGVTAFSDAQKIDASSCAHSPGKPTFRDVAVVGDTQISRAQKHVIDDRAQKPAPPRHIDGPARSGSVTETPLNGEIRCTEWKIRNLETKSAYSIRKESAG